MNEGKFVFTQVVDFIPRYQFDKLVKKYNGNYRAHELTCYNQFLHLLFGQLTACTSIRDICLCLKAHSESLFGLGFRNTVDHTALTRANERRNYLIYEELGYYLIRLVRPLYISSKLPDIEADSSIFAIDSTSISISIKLCVWAFGKYETGAVKTHLWIAICAYLVLALIKVKCKSDYTITEIATLVSVSALAKMPLRDLLTNPNQLTFKSKQNIKDQLTLFD